MDRLRWELIVARARGPKTHQERDGYVVAARRRPFSDAIANNPTAASERAILELPIGGDGWVQRATRFPAVDVAHEELLIVHLVDVSGTAVAATAT